MLPDRIAKRYAASVFTLAQERGEVEKLRDDFGALQNLMQVHPEVRRFLSLPLVRAERKREILHKMFDGRLSKTTALLIDLLTRHGRESVLPQVADAYLAFFNESKNILPVYVRSAQPLSEAQRQALRSQLTLQLGGNVELHERVDPHLLGGLIVRVGDRQVDGSLSSALARLKTQFQDPTYITRL